MQPPEPADYGLEPAEVEQIQAWKESFPGCAVVSVVVTLSVGAIAALGDWGLTVPALAFPVIVGLNRLRLPVEVRRKVRSYRRLVRSREDYDEWFTKTRWEFWNSLSGLRFEQEVADLLLRAGQPVRLTPPSDDHGVDIYLGHDTVVQCKAWSKPVGPGPVRELYGAMTAQGADRGVLVGKSGFTVGARRFAQGKNISLWDAAYLISLQKRLGDRPPSQQPATAGGKR